MNFLLFINLGYFDKGDFDLGDFAVRDFDLGEFDFGDFCTEGFDMKPSQVTRELLQLYNLFLQINGKLLKCITF